MKGAKKKVLFVATVDSHIELFHLPYLKMFKDKGYEVHVATNTDKKIKYCDEKHKISIERNPFKLNNLKAIRELKKIVNAEKFDVIHCHTPMGGVVARLAAKKARKTGTRMIYTAHGFHFYKGAPLHYWMIFYPVEKYLAKYTDTLITINTEDFERAKKKFSKRCKDIEYVPGVGVDEKKFSKKLTAKQKHELRKSLGLKDDDFVMICVGRLDTNKNQGFLIDVTRELLKEDKKYHLLLVGPDENSGRFQDQAKDIKEHVHFLGERSDIVELLNISDVALSASKREGLPVNLIEATITETPIVATDCRGNHDIIEKCAKNRKEFFRSIKNGGEKSNDINNFLLKNITKQYQKVYNLSIGKKLSIVIPFFNSEKFIERCLMSIISQVKDNIELILVDDGSIDNSLKICQEYQAKYTFIKLIRNPKNLGVSAARNNGLKNATGEYTYFVDSDDRLKNNAIAKIIKMSTSRPDIISLKRKKYAGDFSMHTHVIKREFIVNNRIRFDERAKYTEDMDFLLECFRKTNDVIFEKTDAYTYERNENSVSVKNSRKRIDDMENFILKWKQYSDKATISFIAYQFLIICGMVKNYGISSKDEKFIDENIELLNYSRSFKVRIGKYLIKLFGKNYMLSLMGLYLKKIKGVKNA